MRRSRPRRVSSRQAKKNREFVKARVAVIERSEGRCEARFSVRCSGVGQHVHHRKPRSAGGTHDVANLLHLCWHCHHEAHHRVVSARARGLLLHATDEPAFVPVKILAAVE